MTLRLRLVRFAAAAAVLAPFGLSIAAHATPEPPLATSRTERPPLAFGEYLVNLGRIAEGAPAGARFYFRNAGDSPLKILGATPSCGCLAPKFERTDLAPGEAGTFLVAADTAGEALDRTDAAKQYTVDVKYDAGDGPRTERVHLKFVLPARRVTVEPRALIVYQPNDVPTTREVTVTDRRSRPVTILAAEPMSDAVAAELRASESPADPVRATVALTVSKPPAATIRTAVKLHTDDAAQPVIYVPVTIAGPEANASGDGSPLKLVPRSE